MGKIRTDDWYFSDCPKCKEPFAISSELERVLRRSLQTFHCPHGHPMVFSQGPSEEDMLRQERDRLKQDAARKDDEIRLWQNTANRQREEREAAERSARAYKGQATRLKNRAKAGVCPCCNRTFQNLKRHMDNQHPNFDLDVDNVVELGKAAAAK